VISNVGVSLLGSLPTTSPAGVTTPVRFHKKPYTFVPCAAPAFHSAVRCWAFRRTSLSD